MHELNETHGRLPKQTIIEHIAPTDAGSRFFTEDEIATFNRYPLGGQLQMLSELIDLRPVGGNCTDVDWGMTVYDPTTTWEDDPPEEPCFQGFAHRNFDEPAMAYITVVMNGTLEIWTVSYWAAKPEGFMGMQLVPYSLPERFADGLDDEAEQLDFESSVGFVGVYWDVWPITEKEYYTVNKAVPGLSFLYTHTIEPFQQEIMHDYLLNPDMPPHSAIDLAPGYQPEK